MKFFLFIFLSLLVCEAIPAAEPVKSKVMLPGGCFAASDQADTKAFGGFGSSDNESLPLPLKQQKEPRPYLELIAESGAVFRENFEGIEVRLVNGGKNVLSLQAQDSRINLIQEAMDKNGQWKPIEHIPGSWCGNSYHNVFLKPGRYWQFIVPRYSGPRATLIRFKLEISPEETLYSEPYQGGIYPGQFRKVRDP